MIAALSSLSLGYWIIAAIAATCIVMVALTLWVWVDGDIEREEEEGDDW